MVTCANCNHIFEDSTIEKNDCPKCGSKKRIIKLSAKLVARSVTAEATLIVNSAPPFSFGAIVTIYRDAPDGQVVKLVDPLYQQLIDTIQKSPQVIDQIDYRKWEEIIAAAYDKAGFDEVILTPRSADFGRDIIAIKKGFGSVKFIEQVKAYKPGHIVKADEVRALLGVLQAEQDVSKAVFTTTSSFAPRIEDDKLIKPFLPTRLELIDREKLIQRLSSLY